MSNRETVKINFSLEVLGKTFKFKNVKLHKVRYGNSSQVSFYSPMGTVSSVIKQYVKQRWPELGKFNISSSSFAGGDSVRVYLNCVDKELYEEVSSELDTVFMRGSFNGMIDLYEYTGERLVKVPISTNEKENPTIDTKWMQVENRPKYGSTLYKEAQKLGKI